MLIESCRVLEHHHVMCPVCVVVDFAHYLDVSTICSCVLFLSMFIKHLIQLGMSWKMCFLFFNKARHFVMWLVYVCFLSQWSDSLTAASKIPRRQHCTSLLVSSTRPGVFGDHGVHLSNRLPTAWISSICEWFVWKTHDTLANKNQNNQYIYTMWPQMFAT